MAETKVEHQNLPEDGLSKDTTVNGTTDRDDDSSSSDSVDDDSITAAPPRRETRISLDHISTHASMGPDNPVEPYSSFVEVPDEVYDRFPNQRKLLFVFILSFCSFLAPISSTSVLAATPEVAAEFNTQGAIINVANAIYMLMMGLAPIVWGPLLEVYGRRPASLLCSPVRGGLHGSGD